MVALYRSEWLLATPWGSHVQPVGGGVRAQFSSLGVIAAGRINRSREIDLLNEEADVVPVMKF